MAKNERKEFRVDDMIPLHDNSLSKGEFEEKFAKISTKSRQSSMLQNMIGQDLFGNDSRDRMNPELSEAMSKLDAKLNFLIGANIAHDAIEGDMEERPVNLSCTGAAFVPSHPYAKGMYIELKMMLATFPPISMELLGEVMWVRKKKSGEPFIGIKFLFRNKDEEDSLTKYIFKRSREMIRLKKAEEDND